MMNLREASREDIPAIQNLLLQLGGYDPTVDLVGVKFESLLLDRGSICLVAERERELLGIIAGQIIPELALAKDTFLITYLVVSEKARGLELAVLWNRLPAILQLLTIARVFNCIVPKDVLRHIVSITRVDIWRIRDFLASRFRIMPELVLVMYGRTWCFASPMEAGPPLVDLKANLSA